MLLEVALHVSLALGAAVALFITIDSVEAVNRALSRATLVDMLRLQIFNVPSVLQQFAVFSALLGALSAVGALLRRGEVVAVLSSGGSPSLLLRPAVISGTCLALAYAGMTEWIVPTARAEVSAARRRLGLPAGLEDTLSTTRTWFRGRDLVYRVSAIEEARGGTLGGVLILRLGAGRLLERWDIERLRYLEGQWVGEGVVHRRFSAGDGLETEQFEHANIAISEIPRDFVARIGAPDRLSFAALVEATRARERLGQAALEHRIELYRRIGHPGALIAVAVLGAALALRMGRRPSLAACLGVGALGGFSLWFLDEVAVALGSAGAIPPGTAAFCMPTTAVALGAVAWALAERQGISAG